jgi:hypothetical protein
MRAVPVVRDDLGLGDRKTGLASDEHTLADSFKCMHGPTDMTSVCS